MYVYACHNSGLCLSVASRVDLLSSSALGGRIRADDKGGTKRDVSGLALPCLVSLFELGGRIVPPIYYICNTYLLFA